MVDDPSRMDSHDQGPGSADAEQLLLVYRVALECAAHPSERVRVTAGATLAAASWTYGSSDTAPASGRRIRHPSSGQVRAEYALAVALRLDAETDLEFAHDTGVVDWLALVAGERQSGDPWWQPVLDAVAEQRAARLIW